jgi:hypothetical protein
MSPVGTKRRLEDGQSVSALPGYFDINLFRNCQGSAKLDGETRRHRSIKRESFSHDDATRAKAP